MAKKANKRPELFLLRRDHPPIPGSGLPGRIVPYRRKLANRRDIPTELWVKVKETGTAAEMFRPANDGVKLMLEKENPLASVLYKMSERDLHKLGKEKKLDFNASWNKDTMVAVLCDQMALEERVNNGETLEKPTAVVAEEARAQAEAELTRQRQMEERADDAPEANLDAVLAAAQALRDADVPAPEAAAEAPAPKKAVRRKSTRRKNTGKKKTRKGKTSSGATVETVLDEPPANLESTGTEG